jgi:hypothetical protein
MSLQGETKQFLARLQKDKALRDAIRAKQDQTLLYAGNFFAPMWREIIAEKRRNAPVAALETLPDVLARLPSPEPIHSLSLNTLKCLRSPHCAGSPMGSLFGGFFLGYLQATLEDEFILWSAQM